MFNINAMRERLTLARLVGLTLISLFLCVASAANAAAPKPLRVIEVGGAYTLASEVLHEKREYFVHLPPSYWQASGNQRHYPVLYMLDGENFFVTASDITDFMSGGTNGNYAIPEVVVVGVINTNRTRDMTPTRIVHGSGGIGDWSASGGSEDFFRFLQTELIPRIDRDYRTLHYRIAAGHSLAGLAVVNAFQHHPGMFQATIALDPSLWWDNGYLLRTAPEERMPLANRSRLYIGLANTPSINGIYAGIAKVHMDAIGAYASHMSEQPALHDRFAMEYFPTEEHGSVPLVALYNGLEFIFHDYKLTFASGLNDPEGIVGHFRKVSDLLGIDLPPPETLLNEMGMMAMKDLKDPPKALTLLTLATTFYPRSSNAQESLGEAHESAGRIDDAITDYRKALERDPGNVLAKSSLARLQKH